LTEFVSRQIRTLSQIFDFLVLFFKKFNADSIGTILNNFGYDLADSYFTKNKAIF
jgi:hypothetical protein